jgi:hypothetical protein
VFDEYAAFSVSLALSRLLIWHAATDAHIRVQTTTVIEELNAIMASENSEQ